MPPKQATTALDKALRVAIEEEEEEGEEVVGEEAAAEVDEEEAEVVKAAVGHEGDASGK